MLLRKLLWTVAAARLGELGALVLRRGGATALFFLACAGIEGIGHSLMALSAGLLVGRTLSSQGVVTLGSQLPSEPLSLAFVGLVSAFVKGCGATWGATAESRLAQNIANDVRIEVAHRLLASGPKLPEGVVSARFEVRVREVERGVSAGVLGGARALLALAPLAVTLAVICPQLSGMAVLVVSCFALASGRVRRLLRGSRARAQAVAEDVSVELADWVRNLDVFRTFGAGQRALESIAALGRTVARQTSLVEAGRAALSASNEVLAAVALVLLLAASRSGVVSVPSGTLMAFAATLFLAYRPLRDLGDARAASSMGEIALTGLREVIDHEVLGGMPPALSAGANPFPALSAGASPPRRLWGLAPLTLDELGVVREERPVPRTSFGLRPGELVGVVGPTGSGKTTLLRAMLGLEPGTVGTLAYGDEDLTCREPGPSARPFAWAPQEPPLLSASLEENLLIAADPARAERAGRLLAELGAGELWSRYRFERLGAAGRPLSGGEKKWVALVRAILSDQPVLLLDEPTAGLDPASAERLLAWLADHRGERSVLLVTHDVRAARIADRVVRLGEDARRAVPSAQNCARNLGSFSNIKRMSGMS